MFTGGLKHWLAMVFRLRPRFELVAPFAPEEVVSRLRDAVERPGATWPGKVFADHAVLHVPRADQRIYSPFLSLDVSAHSEGSIVRGLISPKPSIWTLFAATYAVCGFGAFFALALAWAQYTMGTPMWGFWLVPVMAVGIVLTYAAALYGQHLGRTQTKGLLSVLEGALGANSDFV
jgi:hypothetical protein